MDTPSPETLVSLFCSNAIRPNAFDMWVTVGCVVNWSLLSITACGMLAESKADIALFCAFFVPCGIAILLLTLFLWHCRRSQRTIATWTRTVGSCIAIDLWAMGCVLVYVEMEDRMWIAAWWFVILPLILFTSSKLVVGRCSARLIAVQWTGEAW